MGDPTRLEIRSDPRRPGKLAYFVNGRQISAHAYAELTRDLCYRVAREQTVLVLLQPPVAEELQPETTRIHTDDLQLTVIQPLREDIVQRKREHLAQYNRSH